MRQWPGPPARGVPASRTCAHGLAGPRACRSPVAPPLRRPTPPAAWPRPSAGRRRLRPLVPPRPHRTWPHRQSRFRRCRKTMTAATPRKRTRRPKLNPRRQPSASRRPLARGKAPSVSASAAARAVHAPHGKHAKTEGVRYDALHYSAYTRNQDHYGGDHADRSPAPRLRRDLDEVCLQRGPEIGHGQTRHGGGQDHPADVTARRPAPPSAPSCPRDPAHARRDFRASVTQGPVTAGADRSAPACIVPIDRAQPPQCRRRAARVPTAT